MTQSTDLERTLAAWMEAAGPQDVPQRVVDGAFREARGIGQQRDITGAVIRWLPGATPVAGERDARSDRRGRIARTLLVALLILVVAGTVAIVGSRLLTPSPTPDPTSVPDLGLFSPTGSPLEARVDHTATLLADGRVLVVGGGPAPRTAEIWDPATGLFTPTVPMATGRGAHTATRLLDGRVLVVGGSEESSDSSRVLDSAEVWDPATGTFSPTGSMVTARFGHEATLLADGRVLISGGIEVQGSVWREVWDPRTGAFSTVAPTTDLPPAADPTTPTIQFLTGTPVVDGRTSDLTRTRLRDGRVLIVGGLAGGTVCTLRPGEHCGGWTVASVAEIWDPTTGTYSRAGVLPRTRHTATLLADGRVLIVGGYGMGEGPAEAAVFQLR